MLLNCNSCQKKFVVPDGAITKSGRLVQCGSCGNKWTQYPEKDISIKERLDNKSKTKITKARSKKNLYSPEYLKKKYGLDVGVNKNYKVNKTLNVKKKKTNFGFYSYIIILFVFLAALFGILSLTEEMIIFKYPATEIYINYFYEVINIIKFSLAEFIN